MWISLKLLKNITPKSSGKKNRWVFMNEVWAAIANTTPWIWHKDRNKVVITEKEISLNEIQKNNVKNIYNGLWWSTKKSSESRVKIMLPILSMHEKRINNCLEKFMDDSGIKKDKIWSDKILKQFVKYVQKKSTNNFTYGAEWSVTYRG